MIPEVQAKKSFFKQIATAFGGIRQERAGAFPLIAKAQNLSPDAAPFLMPREQRTMLAGLPGDVQVIYPCQSGFAVLTELESHLHLYFPVKDGMSAVTFEDTTYFTGYDPSAAWFGTQLFFPAFRCAVDFAKRTVRQFDRPSDEVGGTYTQNSAGETVLTLAFENGSDDYRAGEYVTLHASGMGRNESYLLPIAAVYSSGREISFRGNNLPSKDIFAGGLFYLSRDIPYCTRFATCKNRLWGWDGGDILYASAPGNPMSFATGGDIPDGGSGAVFYPGASEKILAFTSFAGRPVCFTGRSVILVEGETPTEYHSEICEKYGLAEDAEQTIAAVGKDLFFYSDQGVCRYTGKNTEPVFSAPCYTGACACGIGSKYVLWDGKDRLYLYDTDTGVLSEESIANPLVSLAASGTGMYGLGKGSGDAPAYVTCLYGRFPAGWIQNRQPATGYSFDEEKAVESSVTFYPYDLPDRRIAACSVSLELALEQGASLTLFAGYDNEPPRAVGTLTGPFGLHRAELPVPPRRCERLTLSLAGHGAYRISAVGIRLRAV